MMVALGWLLALALAFVVWRLRLRVGQMETKLAEMRQLRREMEERTGDLERGLAVTRSHLVQVVGGEAPAADVIAQGKAFRDIEPAPALVMYEQKPDLFVLDVRTPAEFNAGHIPRAHLIPLDELEDRLKELPRKDAQILVTCAAGGRSTAACQILSGEGFTRLLNLAGGMHAWTGPRDRDASIPPPPPVPTKTGTTINFRGGAVTGDAVVGAIRQCFDPEIPLNVYDLGLIYDIDIDEQAIGIKMTLTSEGCPSARQIPEDVKRKVVALGQPNVTVDVVFDPPWHPARISDDGKQKLGLAS
jgi:metal-sulfur cluster biosynthetic enzyme/rhodanese-related sulfurtransferase